VHSYQQAFLELAVEHGVLKFGEFRLKSGRTSPYFFNLGLISSGTALQRLGRAYAAALSAGGIEFDLLFGPAYKGISLAAVTAVALADTGRDVGFAYNRKEAKDHGEGGVLVGAPPKGRVVVIDDVLTAGTAMREALRLLRAAGAEPVAAIIALDRQEVGPGGLSAVAEIERDEGIKVISLVTVHEILDFLQDRHADPGIAAAIRDYQARYGAAAPA